MTRIDAVTGAQRSLATHHTVSAAAAGAGRVLVAVDHRRSYVEQLAALKGAVARLVVPIYSFDPSDPALARDPFALQAEQATLAGLLNYPDAPAPAGLRLQPEIAAAMPALTPDRRTYTFTIRPGYRFSPPSGEPVTAESFRRGIEHALSPALGDRAPRRRGCSATCVGARAYHAGRAPRIRGVRVHGATLEITLTRPSPDFLKRLSLPYFAPLPAGVPNVAGGAPDHPPPSAGPYYAADAINGEYLLLKRNPYYRGPRPHALDAIVLREGIDAARAIEQVQRRHLGRRHARRPAAARRPARAHPGGAPRDPLRRLQRPPRHVRLGAHPARGRRPRSRAARSRPSGPRPLERAAAAGRRHDHDRSRSPRRRVPSRPSPR